MKYFLICGLTTAFFLSGYAAGTPEEATRDEGAVARYLLPQLREGLKELNYSRDFPAPPHPSMHALRLSSLISYLKLPNTGRTLEELDLSGNPISAEDAKKLAEVLPHLRSLKRLNLGMTNLEEESLISIAASLPQKWVEVDHPDAPGKKGKVRDLITVRLLGNLIRDEVKASCRKKYGFISSL